MAGAPDLAEFYAQQMRSVEESINHALERREWLQNRLLRLNDNRTAVLVKRNRQDTLIQQLRDRRASVRQKLRDALGP